MPAINRLDAFVTTATEKLLTYGVGRELHYYDMPVVRSITREAARNDYRFSSLILGIARSVPFQMKLKKSAEAEAQGATTASNRSLTVAALKNNADLKE